MRPLAPIRFISALGWSENEMDHKSHSTGSRVEILVCQSADIKKQKQKKSVLFLFYFLHVFGAQESKAFVWKR